MLESYVWEWSALIVGTFGTVLWALGKNQLLVSILWLASSILWIVFAQLNGYFGLTTRDAIGLILYLIAIRTYMAKRREEKSLIREYDAPAEVLNLPLRPNPNCVQCEGKGYYLRAPGERKCCCWEPYEADAA